MKIKRISEKEWIYTLDGKTAGHLRAIPVELKVGSRIIPAAWAVDFTSLPEYRRKGIGSALVEEANKHCDVFLAIGATEMSFPLFSKLGWHCLGKLPYYIKVWDANSPLNLLLKVFNFFRRPRKPQDIEVQRIDTFGEEVDLFWKEIAGYYRVMVPRTRSYLKEKYERQPQMNYVKFRAVRKDRVCGFTVLRCLSNKEGLINDIIARPDDQDTLQALVFYALEYLKDKGCSIVRCYTTCKEIQKELLNCGFFRRKPQLRFLIKKNIEGIEEADNMDNWYLTAGDSDIDRPGNK